MEEGISLAGQIRQVFQCRGTDIRTYSPLTLAYIGDSVYELIIRSILVEEGNRSVNVLNKRAVKYVNAQAQAKMVIGLIPELTEEELDVYKRGRNAKPRSTAKNASLKEYHNATGYEALIGYLYLTEQTDRILKLVKAGMDKLEGEEA